MDRTRNAVGVTGCCGGVHGCCPNPGGSHRRGGNTKSEFVASGHITVGVFALTANRYRHDEGSTKEQQEQSDSDDPTELGQFYARHG